MFLLLTSVRFGSVLHTCRFGDFDGSTLEHADISESLARNVCKWSAQKNALERYLHLALAYMTNSFSVFFSSVLIVL